jgi:GntR family transcriptional regulator, trigonelline degradation regulator
MIAGPSRIDSLRITKAPATLREIALGRLRDAIIEGLFEPGHRLVERTLCDQLGVSRSVIREVLRHLDAEGLVETLPKQGPIVARITWDDARQIYDIRAMLEASAVSDCARIADEEVTSRLLDALEGIEQASARQDPAETLGATTRFYELIFAAGGHAIAWEIVRRLNSRISRLRVLTLGSPDRMITGPMRLREIYTAIQRNDPDAAAEACRIHVAQARAIAQGLLNP